MSKQASFPRPAAIVLGCGEVGSAVALALHQAGLAVVLVDEADPVLASARDGVHQCVVRRQLGARE